MTHLISSILLGAGACLVFYSLPHWVNGHGVDEDVLVRGRRIWAELRMKAGNGSWIMARAEYPRCIRAESAPEYVLKYLFLCVATEFIARLRRASDASYPVLRHPLIHLLLRTNFPLPSRRAQPAVEFEAKPKRLAQLSSTSTIAATRGGAESRFILALDRQRLGRPSLLALGENLSPNRNEDLIMAVDRNLPRKHGMARGKDTAGQNCINGALRDPPPSN
ncbi:hypothetical protein C8R45DRAFT_943340 [Mycena sanguinolenta]|nr:hypothetical protein C8R45DRAFT_943340 [Mycena sanguinolenta]